VQYSGQFLNDIRQGSNLLIFNNKKAGKLRLNDQSTYEGTIENGKIHGKGK
jgi:hypothetical protein